MNAHQHRTKSGSPFELSKRQKNFLKAASYHVAVGLIGLAMIYPILWMVAASFKETSEIWTNVDSLFPKAKSISKTIRTAGEGSAGSPSPRTTKTPLSMRDSARCFRSRLGAWSRMVSPGWILSANASGLSIMLATLMLPDQVRMIPQYILFDRLGWINTFYPLLLPRLGGAPFFIFMIVQFIRGIPTELDEAALIDGCSKGGIFFRIILPQLKPAIITAAIFSFYWTWDDFMAPFIYLTRPELHTVSVALRSFSDPASATDWGAIFAMTSLSLLPVFVIFIFFQRYLVEGIATTGLKG